MNWTQTLLTMLAMGLLPASCLSTGCVGPQGVKRGVGYSLDRNAVEVSYWGPFGLWGGKGRIGGDASMEAEITYDPKTGAITGKGKLDSDVSGVLDAEGRRVSAEFLEFRRMDNAARVEQTRLNWAGANEAISTAAGVVGIAAARGATPQEQLQILEYFKSLRPPPGTIGGGQVIGAPVTVLEPAAGAEPVPSQPPAEPPPVAPVVAPLTDPERAGLMGQITTLALELDELRAANAALRAKLDAPPSP